MVCSPGCGYKYKSKTIKQGSGKIKQVSDKLSKQHKEYSKLRKAFLSDPKNKYCPVTKLEATEIHHKKGRGAYLNDVSTWLAVSRQGHIKIEENPIWAKENGYSENRL